MKITKRKLDAILLAGRMMSNICFNGKQSLAIPEDYRNSMKECQEDWDRATKALIRKKATK